MRKQSSFAGLRGDNKKPSLLIDKPLIFKYAQNTSTTGMDKIFSGYFTAKKVGYPKKRNVVGYLQGLTMVRNNADHRWSRTFGELNQCGMFNCWTKKRK